MQYLLLSVIFGNGITYLLASLASQHFSRGLDVFIVAFLSNASFCTSLYLLLPTLRDSFRFGALQGTTNRLLVLILLAFVASIAAIGFSFPSLLNPEVFRLEARHIAPALISAVFSTLTVGSALRLIHVEGVWKTKAWKTLLEYLPGLGIAVLFVFTYFILAVALNPSDFNTNNIFFAADSNNWRVKLATQEGYAASSRAVHPYALLLLRPPIGILAFLLGGGWHYAGLFALALAGGLCVFGVWVLLQKVSPNSYFPVVMAMIFGSSTTQLLFSSVMEIYVFSALSLISLFIVLQRSRPSLPAATASALFTFGLLITNFIQSIIAITIVRPRAALLLKFVTLVLFFAALLGIVSHFLYPGTDLFFVPANLFEEDRFVTDITRMTFTEIRSRIILLIKDFTMFNMLAPEPYQSERTKEGRDPFPKFNFFNPSFYQYPLPGAIALGLWISILLYAGIRFFLQGRANHPLSFAAMGTIIYNFGLHLSYGFEPFLYSANWTYALIILVSYAIAGASHAKWLQALLTVLLILTMINNAGFIYQIIAACVPYFS
jgi:hypothetical protein